MDPLALQRNVRHNASEIQNAIADLTSWEDTIKTRDKKRLKVRTDARAEPPATPACRQAKHWHASFISVLQLSPAK